MVIVSFFHVHIIAMNKLYRQKKTLQLKWRDSIKLATLSVTEFWGCLTCFCWADNVGEHAPLLLGCLLLVWEEKKYSSRGFSFAGPSGL